MIRQIDKAMGNSIVCHFPLKAVSVVVLIVLFIAGWPSLPLAAETVEIRIAGIEGGMLKNVESALLLPSGLITDGVVNKPWLEHFSHQAESRVREALEPFGYYGSQITTLLEENKPAGYVLQVSITAGEPVLLTKVEVNLQGTGATESLLLEKAASFPLHPGDRLQHEQYETAKSQLLVTARELGYLDADFSVHTIKVDPLSRSASINLLMASGPRYLFGETDIEGAVNYPKELLQRYISFSPGNHFSYKQLGKTQLNFVGSTYFKSVTITPDKDAASDFQVPVVISVTPAPRRTIRPGVGYGTDTGFRGSVGYRDLSFLSPGNIFNTEITVAEKLQGISSTYSIPDKSNLQAATALQVNLQRELVNDIRSTIMSMELSRSTDLGNNRLGTAFVRLQREQFSVGLEDSTSILLLPGLRFSQRRYDDLIRPTKGYHIQLETNGTLKAFGSDVEFVQFIAESGGLLPLPWGLSLHGRSKGGATLTKTPFADLPTSLRFFAGGDQSVRGYAYKSLGPTDASGDVIGGKYLLNGSVELEKAFTNRWGVSLFYDAGNAFDSLHGFRMYQGTGIGYHYYTPIGAINLDLARQIGIPDPTFRFHFTIGFQL